MELGREYKAKNGNKMKHWHGGRIALNPDNVVVIKIPDAQVLRIMSRSLFLALILAMLPFLGSILREFSSSSHSIVSGLETASGSINVELLNSILHDLAEEGLFRKDDEALIVDNGFEGFSNSPFKNSVIDMVMDSDLERKSLFPDEFYDFVFMSSSEDAQFVDRILKIDGVVALPLGTKPSSNDAFKKQSNYRLVFLRRYGSIIVALRKTGSAKANIELVDSSSSPKRKLCQLAMATEAKTVALKGLEDVLLEPPSPAFTKSKKYLKNIKYLPDLLGDSLEGYKRRVFLGVGLPYENEDVIQWFLREYPKKNTKFEIHTVLVDVSDLLSKHVKEEKYVVMKAEAEVVEAMIKKGTICLVDEIFVECKNEWWQKGKRNKSGSGRAYRKCLALYGSVRDEGLAVHQ